MSIRSILHLDRVGVRLIGGMLVLVAGITTASSMHTLSHERAFLGEQIDAQGAAISSAASNFCSDALLLGDYSLLNNYLQTLVERNEDVAFVKVLRPDESIAAIHRRPVIEKSAVESPIVKFSEEIVVGPDRPEAIGKLVLGFSTRRTDALIRARLFDLLKTSVAAFLGLAVVLALLVKALVGDPLRRLDAHAQGLSSGDMETAVSLPGSTEFTRLADTLDEMRRNIRQFESEIRASNAELRNARDDLERRVKERTASLSAANKELEAFTYAVAHDLRAPIRHIGSFTRILSDEINDRIQPDSRQHLTYIASSAKRMAELVDGLLNLSRVGRHEAKMVLNELNPLVDEAISAILPQLQGRTIVWDVAPLPAIKCNTVLLKIVFDNLISNAIKYTAHRDPAEIHVEHVVVEGCEAICVRDNGVGFDMKHADSLFGVFQRLHRNEEFEGAGIGLATVQRIIRMHGGEVWAQAEPDKGAAFFFTLTRTERTHEERPEASMGRGP